MEKTNMRLTRFFPLILMFSISGPLFAQEWMEFASREDRFTCLFPEQPKVNETTYLSEYEADLPARGYSVTQGQSRYSVTVVDYNQVQPILTAKAKSCPAGDVVCRGVGGSGEGWWKVDRRAALVYASWKFMQRDAKVTQYQWNFLELVEGHQLSLTNADKSRTFAAVYMHENKLYMMESTVPPGYPEPSWFSQSLGFLDERGIGLRYQEIYVNGFPAPPRVTAIFSVAIGLTRLAMLREGRNGDSSIFSTPEPEVSMPFKSIFSLVAISSLVFTVAASAHHSPSNYTNTYTDIEGVVKEVHLVVPHSWVYLEVKDGKGEPQVWVLEAIGRV